MENKQYYIDKVKELRSCLILEQDLDKKFEISQKLIKVMADAMRYKKTLK